MRTKNAAGLSPPEKAQREAQSAASRVARPIKYGGYSFDPGRRSAMSIKEFCNRNDVGRTKTYEEIKSGRLRARKVGRHTIITGDDEADWLAALPVVECSCTEAENVAE